MNLVSILDKHVIEFWVTKKTILHVSHSNLASICQENEEPHVYHTKLEKLLLPTAISLKKKPPSTD